MGAKSYTVESIMAVGFHGAAYFKSIAAVVCGSSMGSTSLLEECLETLEALGLITHTIDEEYNEPVYTLTDHGKLVYERLTLATTG